MLISYNWLKQYVKLSDSLTPEELALKLTMSTVEVEGVEIQGKNLENIVVGEVKKVEKHSDADSLQVCSVNDGSTDHQVVCGGSNVVEGMKVALGKIGSKVKWHGEGDLVELTKVKIRGIDSHGMICASTEIGLGELFPPKDKKEILDLSDLDLKVGLPLVKALGLNDAVLDIDNKSMTHRPDLWGHYGMAREVASLYHKDLKKYNSSELKKGKGLVIKVENKDQKLCSRYMAVALSGVEVKESPEWLKQKLIAVGLRPINNIVDVTNYILMDLGQPMHAFDARQLETIDKTGHDKRITVRRAENKEEFTSLDGSEYILDDSMLVIADEEKPVALAGIIGGLNSEIQNNTTTIIFESANFDATTIRRTATKLGIRTDSSTRFEKSLDPNNAELALKRAVELVLEMCPEAKIVSNIVDEKKFSLYAGPIELSLEFLNKKIGIDLEKKQVINILESLGFGVKEKKDIFLVTIPTWRATKDISIPEDLVEEVARIYGYNNIEVKLPEFPIIPPKRNGLRDLERQAKDIISMEHGYTETYNYSFVSPEWIKKMGLKIEDHIELDNPIAKDRPYVCTTLLPNLLENVEKNMHYTNSLRLFEVGKVFDKNHSGVRAEEKSDELLPRQDLMLTFVYSEKGSKTPFYEVSEVVSSLLDKFGVDYELKVSKSVSKSMHPGREAEILVGSLSTDVQGKEVIGFISELHPQVQIDLGIDERVGMVEINLNNLLKYVKDKMDYNPLPLYPVIERDIAFVVDKTIVHKDIENSLREVDEIIKSVELFDVYSGENIDRNKKSMAYHILYRSDDKTLESNEVDKIHKKVVKVLQKKFEANMR